MLRVILLYFLFHFISLRATACDASRVVAIVDVFVRPSVVCLSVRLSVTLLSSIKTVQEIAKSSLWASTKTRVFNDKSSCPWMRGFPSNDQVKEGLPPKDPYFSSTAWKRLQIGSDMMHVIASTGDKLFMSINIDDLEWPWTPRIRRFSNFLRLWAATHILRVNCAETADDSWSEPAYEIFSNQRKFQQFKYWPPSNRGNPLKMVILPLLVRLA